MIIPVGYAHVIHFFGGTALPEGAAVTHGCSFVGVGTLESKAEAIADAMEDNFLPQMANTVSYLGCLVKAGPNTTGPSYQATRAVAGGGSDPALPPNCTVLIQKKTALGGRRNRGRFYFPGLAETVVDEKGDIGGTQVTAWQAAATAFLADLETAEAPMVILHDTSSDPTSVVSLAMQSRIATQRRRLR